MRIIGQMLESQIRNRLSTGQTPQHDAIVSQIHAQYPFDVSRITLFNVDELTTCQGIFRQLLHHDLKPDCQTLGIAKKFYYASTLSDDFGAECKLFEKR